jgi:lipoprotein-anchoring transpeptidase ErfK/SrfK
MVPAGASAVDPLPNGVIAPGVTIDGVAVGGVTLDVARKAVLDQRIIPRQAPLVVSLAGRRMALKPKGVGYVAELQGALEAAYAQGRTVPLAGPVNVPLVQSVDPALVRSVLEYRRRDIEVSAVDAAVIFRTEVPRVRPARIGIAIDVRAAVPLVAQEFVARTAPIVTLPVRRVKPARMRVGASIVVNRRNRTLKLYSEATLVRSFRIAVGTPQHPTPRGRFRIIEKQRNPTWFPPDSPWAAGLGPKPPGPGNPLGTRWMGTSAPAIGIHGTPASYSIGTAASHGCIRMYIREAEWLYNRVRVGTTVLIV